jgi:hypothetical protein
MRVAFARAAPCHTQDAQRPAQPCLDRPLAATGLVHVQDKRQARALCLGRLPLARPQARERALCASRRARARTGLVLLLTLTTRVPARTAPAATSCTSACSDH